MRQLLLDESVCLMYGDVYEDIASSDKFTDEIGTISRSHEHIKNLPGAIHLRELLVKSLFGELADSMLTKHYIESKVVAMDVFELNLPNMIDASKTITFKMAVYLLASDKNVHDYLIELLDYYNEEELASLKIAYEQMNINLAPYIPNINEAMSVGNLYEVINLNQMCVPALDIEYHSIIISDAYDDCFYKEKLEAYFDRNKLEVLKNLLKVYERTLSQAGLIAMYSIIINFLKSCITDVTPV